MRLWILFKPSIYLAFSDMAPARELAGDASLLLGGPRSQGSPLSSQ